MMRHLLILTFLILLSVQSFSQIIFENGYFIDTNDTKIECLIKNVDWKNNPTSFEYKLTQDAAVHRADVNNVKEFGIYGVSKYIQRRVKIDRSGNSLAEMNSERNPIFQEESLFLRVVIEGNASLFQYQNGNLIRFFYKTNDTEITQLIYKRYKLNGKVASNVTFKQQLFTDLKSERITLREIEKLRYNLEDLKRLFTVYNASTNINYIDVAHREVKDIFNMSLRPGISSSRLSVQNSLSSNRNTDFGNKLNFRLGIETEFILKFNKNKWSIILEPTYRNYKSEKTSEINNISGGFLVSKVYYQSFELPIGLRHYFYLNDGSKIFANVSYVFDSGGDSYINFSRSDGSAINSVAISSSRNFALGVGYKYKNRYSLEMRYLTNRQILGDYFYWNSRYKTTSIIFGYSFF